MAGNTRLETLDKFIQKYCEPVKRNSGLLVMKRLMSFLGNPQESLNIIHIAGTSGKTSTAYYLADMLTKSGLKIGLTVSPYVDKVTERFQLNMIPISEELFSIKVKELTDILKEESIRPNYFEFMTALAYWIFAYFRVDYAVIEVGIGGTQDSTNIAQSKNKICVITDIGMDHMEILGNTIESITKNKAGIIHSGNVAFMHQQNDIVNKVLLNRARSVGAELNFVDVDKFEKLTTNMPEYQARNWLLAHEVYRYISKKDKLVYLDNKILEKSTRMQVPGRMDVINYMGHSLIFDGAHNEQKMTALVNSIIKIYGNNPINVILSLKDGKDYESIIKQLSRITDRLIITKYDYFKKYPVRSLDPGIIKKSSLSSGIDKTYIEENYDSALDSSLKYGKVTLVTGSFYLLSEIRRRIK